MDRSRIRNFSIIAHIDHGKSTLSDRVLELTGAVDPREMREQYLDSMDLERERGITIKAQNVRVNWKGYTLHLIDTPGHVDFGYEVSRSLAACEGVVLIVDAAQGIEAQTLANCYLALENDLEVVAALNKTDLPAAEPERYAQEIENVLGLPAEEIMLISAKTGQGVPELLDAIIAKIPAPGGDPNAPLQALMFDSIFDQYRGVVSSIRVMNGTISTRQRVRFMNAGAIHEIDELGLRLPLRVPRSPAHGDRQGAARARVRSCAHRHRAERRVHRAHHRRGAGGGRQPERPPGPERDRPHRGAVLASDDPYARHLRWHDHRAVPEPSRRDGEDGIPLTRANGARVPHPPRGARCRLLRPAEEPHAGVRQPRLRNVRLRNQQSGARRYLVERRHRRRLFHDRAPGRGLRVRPAHVREVEGTDPTPAVRRTDPGRHRGPVHRPPDGESQAQGRAREVLRR